MTQEITTSLPPKDVLARVRRHFVDGPFAQSAYLVDESDVHLTFAAFRNRIAVSARVDPERPGLTRVRVSTTRPGEVAAKVIGLVLTSDGAGPPAPEPATAAADREGAPRAGGPDRAPASDPAGAAPEPGS